MLKKNSEAHHSFTKSGLFNFIHFLKIKIKYYLLRINLLIKFINLNLKKFNMSLLFEGALLFLILQE